MLLLSAAVLVTALWGGVVRGFGVLLVELRAEHRLTTSALSLVVALHTALFTVGGTFTSNCLGNYLWIMPDSTRSWRWLSNSTHWVYILCNGSKQPRYATQVLPLVNRKNMFLRMFARIHFEGQGPTSNDKRLRQNIFYRVTKTIYIYSCNLSWVNQRYLGQ